jgi:hypothetical protein
MWPRYKHKPLLYGGGVKKKFLLKIYFPGKTSALVLKQI